MAIKAPSSGQLQKVGLGTQQNGPETNSGINGNGSNDLLSQTILAMMMNDTDTQISSSESPLDVTLEEDLESDGTSSSSTQPTHELPFCSDHKSKYDLSSSSESESESDLSSSSESEYESESDLSSLSGKQHPQGRLAKFPDVFFTVKLIDDGKTVTPNDKSQDQSNHTDPSTTLGGGSNSSHSKENVPVLQYKK